VVVVAVVSEEVMVAKVEVVMALVAMVLTVDEEVDTMAVEEISEVVIEVDTREHSHFLFQKLFSSFILWKFDAVFGKRQQWGR
jgi:hypothetical protein